MPPKKKRGKQPDDSKKSAVQKSGATCLTRAPGPKYKLKPLVGYNDHCASRNRNPAYSIAARQTGGACSEGPGPIYYAKLPEAEGFSFGRALRGAVPACGPGPYLLPDPPRGPEFSMKWRTGPRCGDTSPGPYALPSKPNGPFFKIGERPEGERCAGGPGPSPPYSIDVIKPKAPEFSIGYRQTDSGKCGTPGPYDPFEFPKTPKYSFGIRHGPCAPPYITECDDMC